jgi:Phospholipase_D-nuclease N-terminal
VRYLPFVLALGLTIYAVLDCARTPDAEIKYLPKVLWLIVVLLIWVVGPVLWLLSGRDRGVAEYGQRSRPLAPDDDPEFLRGLREKLRRDDDNPDRPA